MPDTAAARAWSILRQELLVRLEFAINSGYVTASSHSLCDKFLRTTRTKELMEVIKTLRKDTSREDQFR